MVRTNIYNTVYIFHQKRQSKTKEVGYINKI